MPRAINGGEGGSGGTNTLMTSNILSTKSNGHNSPISSISSSSTVSISSATSGSKSSTSKRHQNNGNIETLNKNNASNTSSDDLTYTDEIKVYKDEGAAEEEQRNSENLNEDKIGLVNETEEEKPQVSSHRFSVDNLMLYNGQDHLTSSAAVAAAAAAAQLGLSRNLYNPWYSTPELAHLASLWPAGLYNHLSSPHTFPFSTSFASTNYNAQHAAAAAAFGRFNPLFLPPSSSPNGSNNANQPDNLPNNTLNNRIGVTSSNVNNGSNSFMPSYKISATDQVNSISTTQSFPQNTGSHNHNRSHTKTTNGNSVAHSPLNEIETKIKKPHIKKPLNAFMLFMKEQRSKVVSECTLRESAAINQILGRKWHELDRADQAKYYEMARQERLKHMQLYPGWSARDNYGLKKKRRRKREKIIGENGELPRKCRARYGLHQISLWCKPCRRKKKCIRFTSQDEVSQNSLQISSVNQNVGNNIQLNYSNIGLNGTTIPSNFSCGSVGEGSSGGVGSGGSLNGGNSDDEYDQYGVLDEDDEDEDECDEEDENFDDSQDSDTENKNHLLCNNNPTNTNSNHLNNLSAISNRIGNIIGNTNNQNMTNINLNNGLNLHDFNVANLDQKNEILIKPDSL